jgi:hypothetical protein
VTSNQPDVLNEQRRMRSSIRACVSALCALTVLLGVNETNSFAQSLQPFPYNASLGNAIAIQNANQPALLATEGVRGVGVTTSGGSLGLLVLVDTTNTAAVIPASLDGLPVTVRAVGAIHLLGCAGENPQVAYPLPIPLGVSGGNVLPFLGVAGDCASGTIGFKVRDNTAPGVVGWISNSHVVAGGTNGCAGGAPLGIPEYQPGPVDTTPACSAGQLVGTLNRFIPLNFNGAANEVDAGFVQSSDSVVSSDILNLGPQVNNVVPAFVGQSVQKEGRTTSCTEGTVSAINLTVSITGDGPTCADQTFTNQIMVGPFPPLIAFAAPGDSGSPVVDSDNNAVGLLFAGDTLGDAFVNPIQAVLDALNVSLASSVSSQVVTRTSRFWFTHAYSLTDTNCVTLLNAIQANGNVMNLGFITLPTADRNADNTIDAYDTIIEALSFYYRSVNVTGEPGGLQGAKAPASALCVARKQLSVELIAASANVALFDTFPGSATYMNGGVTTNFPPDLLSQAQTVNAGYDTTAIHVMTALLRKFNSSGVTNNLPNGLVECSPQSAHLLKSDSQDPTLQDTCPGVNNSCASAQVVMFPNSSDPFARALFTASAALNSYTNNMPTNSCAMGNGPDAVWQIPPSIGLNGRQFTVSTAGSNFDTALNVFSGSCTNLTEVTCANAFLGTEGESLSFTTDGTNTFYIVGQGGEGGYGSLKIKVTSP